MQMADDHRVGINPADPDDPQEALMHLARDPYFPKDVPPDPTEEEDPSEDEEEDPSEDEDHR